MNKTKGFVRIVLIASVFILCGCNTSLCEQKDEQNAYLYSYFVGNGEDGLHLAYSFDGLNWQALNDGKSFLAPTAGGKLMRDPCILRGPTGTFHMVWTTSWGQQGIGYAHSKDLISWSEQEFIPVMADETTAMNCWAPEVFYDDENKQFLIFWSTTIPGRFPQTDQTGDNKYNHRIYCTTTKDFKEFSPTKLFYDDGFNVIDATIVRAGDEFVMFIKDETRYPPKKNIRIARSKKAVGPYGEASNPITGNYWAEGPSAIKIDGKWYLYFDKYRQGKYGVLVSRDLITWNDISDQLHMPNGVRHGTMLTIPLNILKNLQEQ